MRRGDQIMLWLFIAVLVIVGAVYMWTAAMDVISELQEGLNP